MKKMLLLLSVAAFCHLLLTLVTARADAEQVPTAKEIAQAEGVPPLMPHAAPAPKKGSEEAACLACHEEGKNSAPQTPHAERRACTQCHVQGEIKSKAKAMKKGQK